MNESSQPDCDPPVGACPSWCSKPAGHDWDDLWGEDLVREHVGVAARLDQYNAVVVREYERHNSSGRFHDREIALDVDGGKGWNATEAQSLIAALAAAIELIGEPVQSSQTCTDARVSDER